jgi:hypothetical protein
MLLAYLKLGILVLRKCFLKRSSQSLGMQILLTIVWSFMFPLRCVVVHVRIECSWRSVV